jgi:hypothetical protein
MDKRRIERGKVVQKKIQYGVKEKGRRKDETWLAQAL